jgi:hypothetical protein
MRLQKPAWDKNSSDGTTSSIGAIRGEEYLASIHSDWFGLSYNDIERLANIYFNTFNYLYPFMDREWFFTNTLPTALEGSKRAEEKKIITLLVLALGQLAQEGSGGTPISRTGNRCNGVRGGTADLPPGVSLFDEARQRLGFVATQYELENVQIFALTG